MTRSAGLDKTLKPQDTDASYPAVEEVGTCPDFCILHSIGNTVGFYQFVEDVVDEINDILAFYVAAISEQIIREFGEVLMVKELSNCSITENIVSLLGL